MPRISANLNCLLAKISIRRGYDDHQGGIHGSFIFCATGSAMTPDQARTIVGRCRRVAFLTGAGISAESGIATFRDDGGLRETYDPADFASVQGIAKIA